MADTLKVGSLVAGVVGVWLVPHTSATETRWTTSTNNELCPQGGCSGEGEYTTQQDPADNSARNKASTRSTGRRNQTLPERRIQPARRCKQQRNPPLVDNKANDGISNPDENHRVPEPIAAPAPPGDIPSKARIRWPRGNQSAAWSRLDQELSANLTVRLHGSTAAQLSSFC